MSFKFGASTGSSGSTSGGGGGLYAGISLAGKNDQQPSKKDSDNNQDESGSSKVDKVNQDTKGSNEGPDQDSASKDENKKVNDDKSKASSWSSSLRFAPVIRKQPAKSSNKPFAVPFSSSVTTKSGLAATAFAPEDEAELQEAQPAGRVMHIPGRAKAALTAPLAAGGPSKAPSVFARKGGFLAAHAPERIPGVSPTSNAASGTSATQLASAEKVDSSIPGFQHSLPAILAQTTTLKGLVPNIKPSSNKTTRKKLEQPPPLTLPDNEFGAGGGGDVNGFGQSEAGRKLALRAARNSKKSKKKGKAREVDPAILFMEDYDPARPNDYHEWMNFVKRRREMRREAIRQERERQRRMEREEASESSVYTSDEESASDDDAPPRGNVFPPPADYNDPAPADVESSSAPVVPISRTETGDEAYARRVALSQGIPYQPPQARPVTENAGVVGSTSGTGAPSAMSSYPSFVGPQIPSKATDEGSALREDHEQSNASVPLGNSASPPAFRPPPALNSVTTIQEAQAKAKLIAAKLAALNGGGNSSSAIKAPAGDEQQPVGNALTAPVPPPEPISKAPGQPDFARRLMDKYGWKEGQGLGANESGRTSILTVATGNQAAGSKKRKDNPVDIGAGPMPPNKVGVMGKGRGVVVDEAKAQRDLEEKQRYGEPTRVVYLTNVVDVHEVDDDLTGEIAEEAGKHGIVERCFVRIVQRPVEDQTEAVRVFILYSGLVGAWKAVKTFDGRFFGGRNIRARFFSENLFNLGDWDA